MFKLIYILSIQLSSIFTMPLAASLCESSFGWRSIYYLQGGITVIAFSAFYFFYQDFPHIHRHVSIKELSRIQKDKIEAANHSRVPYFAVARDPCIIGVWLVKVCY
uniref:MFS domain-containing protein n=1 Tax=Heterorhabditis bacteriophora TaxID=37862 RepID=A0A1I7WXW3_HETBA